MPHRMGPARAIALAAVLGAAAVAEASEIVTYAASSSTTEEAGKKRAAEFAPQFTLLEIHPGVALSSPDAILIECEVGTHKGGPSTRGPRNLTIVYSAVFSELSLDAYTFGSGLLDEDTTITDRQGNGRFVLELPRAWLSADPPTLWQVEVVTAVSGNKKLRGFETECSLEEPVSP